MALMFFDLIVRGTKAVCKIETDTKKNRNVSTRKVFHY